MKILLFSLAPQRRNKSSRKDEGGPPRLMGSETTPASQPSSQPPELCGVPERPSPRRSASSAARQEGQQVRPTTPARPEERVASRPRGASERGRPGPTSSMHLYRARQLQVSRRAAPQTLSSRQLRRDFERDGGGRQCLGRGLVHANQHFSSPPGGRLWLPSTRSPVPVASPSGSHLRIDFTSAIDGVAC